jgi:hypothetical protein
MAAPSVPAIPSRRSSDFLGKIVHNLVVAYDSGDASPEFRVQCEVLLSFEEAQEVIADLKIAREGSTADGLASLEHARKIVLAKIHPKARPSFKRALNDGFDENLAQIQNAARTPRP